MGAIPRPHKKSRKKKKGKEKRVGNATEHLAGFKHPY